ncbi:nuclear pore complex protein DDB_G0274915-like isoform X2 [Hetaerina americana]|uniref:nuclear pore complex protein DDB_G0274915-like isoform X2 n=1 Tax=Hetaerina americana TaxID=62018 RepID=UPI003A7F4548
MSQIHRRAVSCLIVFLAFVVSQFSTVLALPLVIAAFLYQGFKMSDHTVNVQNSPHGRSLVSSLYSWAESTVSSLVEKYKNLSDSGTEPRNRLPMPTSGRTRNITTPQSFRPPADRVSHMESIYQGTSFDPNAVGDFFGNPTPSYSGATSISEGRGKSSKSNSEGFTKPQTSTSRYDNDSFSHKSSPWGYSLSPQQTYSAAGFSPVTVTPSTLPASSIYNTSRDAELFAEVNSPGFCSRLLKYHSEAENRQRLYKRTKQSHLIDADAYASPHLDLRQRPKVRTPFRDPPAAQYDDSESSLCARSEERPTTEEQSKAFIAALKAFKRKRLSSEDEQSDAKRHHPQSDTSSSSSPAVINGVLLEQTQANKRSREEGSPKLTKPMVKRTRNNEIYSSLSSSLNIKTGTKRKADDNWTEIAPIPIGKYLKKSPHKEGPLEENADTKSAEELKQKREPSALPKHAAERNLQNVGQRETSSLTVNVPKQVDPQPSSSHHMLESSSKESVPSKDEDINSYRGRLFFKTLSRGNIPSQAERLKRRSDDTVPWVTAPAVNNEPICDDDGRPWYESEADRRRLNSLLSVLRSNESASHEPPTEDAIDAPSSQPDAPKLQSSTPDPKGAAPTIKLTEKSISNATLNLGEQPLTNSNAVGSDGESEALDKAVLTIPNSQGTPTLTFGSVQRPSPSSSALLVATEKSESVLSSAQAPAPAISFSTSLNSTSATTSLPVTSITPAPGASLATRPTPTSSETTTSEAPSKIITSTPSMASSGLFASPSTSTFIIPQQTEKTVTTASTFTFGVSSSGAASSTAVSSSSFGLPTSSVSTPAVSSLPQPTVTPSSFTTLSQNPSTALATNFTVSKSDAPTSSSGGFSFAPSSSAAPSTSVLGGFSIPKTTTTDISFGISNAPTSTFVSKLAVTSPQSESTPVTTSTNVTSTKSFSFGATQPTVPQESGAAPSASGFNFQFGSNAQSNLTAPKAQETPAGFKFSFDSNKEGTGLSVSQPSVNPIAKSPAFGEGFNFGANSSNVNSEENKPMTLGTPMGLTPTLAGPAAAPSTSGGFNFSADTSASASIPKPSFGFGASNTGGGATGSVLGSSEGGFSFQAKSTEPPQAAPSAAAAPSLGSPFQFGTNSQAMPSSTLQPQNQTVNSPFSIGAASEQKSTVLGGGFSFGSTPSASIPPLQQSGSAFGQSPVPNFGSPAMNPMQNQQAAPAPSLFQFGSGGGAMPPPANTLQPGMQAPAMFSIGSGSTAPRSRSRSRRQK